MKNFTVDKPSRIRRWLNILADLWHWLVEPSSAIIEPERRQQARLLMAMLFLLLIFGILGTILSMSGAFSVPGESENVSRKYIWTTLSVVLLLTIEYGLSRTIHYPLAAMLSIGTVLIAIFLTAILDPGNRQILSFLVLGGLMGSLFFSARTTAIIFFVTFIGLLSLPALIADFSITNNLNTLFFILTVAGLVVMATTLRGRYLEQIAWQTQQLVESEARLRDLSMRDPLTGLFNRRYLEESLTLELVRAARKHYTIGIIMADIDHFKQFNDTYGHAAGDAVLVQIANFLRSHVRLSDITCRYGGEEFILILPETSLETSLMRAELMRASAGQLRVQYENRTIEAVTLSLGVSIFPNHGSTMEALLAAADAALYRAKHAGRDRVIAANVQGK